MTKQQKLPLAQLVLEHEYYPRFETDWVTVAKYVDAMHAGCTFPPIDVVIDGKRRYIVLDGWHRIQAARRIKVDVLSCVVHDLPMDEWLLFAAERNAHNARPLTVRDRAMVTNRLLALGIKMSRIVTILGCTEDTLKKWQASRIIDDGKGGKTAAKSAMLSLVGTSKERGILRHGGPVANASVRRTLDEMLALLRAGLVDPSVPDQREKMEEIATRLGKLLSRGRKDTAAT